MRCAVEFASSFSFFFLGDLPLTATPLIRGLNKGDVCISLGLLCQSESSLSLPLRNFIDTSSATLRAPFVETGGRTCRSLGTSGSGYTWLER